MIRCELGTPIVDQRGVIRDLLVESMDSVTMIETKKGAVRGHHYHRETFQWTYVLRGRMRVLSQDPTQTSAVVTVLEPGDLALSPPLDAHAWEALEDSTVLVLTRGPRSGEDYESDTIRLKEPLRCADD